ncbi:MAG: adenylate/guanylate cyclase domain-containing protein [Actinomycetota bacterium]
MQACPSCQAANPEGSRFCNACGERLPGLVAPVEVRKTVTVVFCDVSGSTALGERLDPEALRRVMMRYFEEMTRAVERHGGTVEKFIGDAVMAVFGIPVTHEDDALRAVRAAHDMREGLRLLNKELERDHGATIACRIGVNTGEVVAGDASARQALITGDTVNVASRLEQAAPSGEVLLSELTVRLVSDAAITERVEPLELKGKRERVSAFRLVSVHEEVSGTARRLDSPLVGRARQLSQLRQAFEEVAADRVCHLFTVLGAAGVGKSRLVQEAIDELRGAATVLRGRCLSYGEGITYFPLIEIIRDALDVDPLEGGDVAATIAGLIPYEPGAAQIAATLASLLGTGTATVEDISWAARRFLEAMAVSRPVVVVLDDLHWGEQSLLDLVDQIADWSRDAPILLVCMARPELLELRKDWGGGKRHATTVALEPLSSKDAERLVANFLGGEGVDPALTARIVTAAEGNPLFMEETLGMLIDDGLVRLGDGRWTATESLEDVTVPPTIQALLEARLDRLDEADRAVLGRAAIVGQVFYLEAVRALSPEADGPEVAGRVQQLLRRDLIGPDRSDMPGQEAFRFHHALLREAAYAMLPKQTRAELHERFAEWLDERRATLDVDEFVGYHLEQAHAYRVELGPDDDRTRDLARRAADRLAAAAARASDRSDSRAGEALFRRAAALREPDDPRRGDELLGVGWALVDQDRDPESAPWFEEALAISRRTQDVRVEMQSSMGLAYARWTADPEGGSDAMQALLDRAIPRLEAVDDVRGLGFAHFMQGQVHWNACRFGPAREQSAMALAYAQGAGDGQLARAAMTTMVEASLLGDATMAECEADGDQLERYADQVPSTKGFALVIRSVLSGMLGGFDEARRLHDDAVRVLEEFRGELQPMAYLWRWRVETLSGDYEAAERAAATAYGLLIGISDVAHASTAAGIRGSALVRLGRDADARHWAAVCRETSASDDVENQFLWRAIDAVVLAREGRTEEAQALIDVGLDWANQTDELLSRADLYLDRAEVLLLSGLDEKARDSLRSARELLQRKGVTAGEAMVDRHAAVLGLG